MLYLGCFQFDCLRQGEPMTGGFEVLAEAETPEAAVRCFRRHLEQVRKKTNTLSGEINIYLGGILEVRRPPRSGILVNWRGQRMPEKHSMVSCLTPVSSRSVASYYWRHDERAPAKDDEEIDMPPFMGFSRQKPKPKRPPKK